MLRSKSIKSLSVAILTLALSTSVNAAIISYNGYSLDTNTSLVSGGGLEWLQWDETKGQSIETALSTYGSQGWRLASTEEMTSLFNSFALGTTFANDVPTYYERYAPLDAVNDFNKFISLFGDTQTSYPSTVDGVSQALFGNYPDPDLLYNRASVVAYNDTASFIYATSSLTGNFITKSSSIENVGIALVCDSGSCTVPSVVPVPAAIWLFGSGLIGLVGFARRKA